MSRDPQSTATPRPALEEHACIAVAPSEAAPIVYWNVCQGIPPTLIESPRLFFAAQAIVAVFSGVAVVMLLVMF